MGVPDILVKSSKKAIEALLKSEGGWKGVVKGTGGRISAKAYLDELVRLPEQGLKEMKRMLKKGWSKDVKWHGTDVQDSYKNFQKGVYNKDYLGLHVGDAPAALGRGQGKKGPYTEVIKDALEEGIDKEVNVLKQLQFPKAIIDEKMADKLRIADLDKAIKATKAGPRIEAWPQESGMMERFYKGWNSKISPSLGHQASKWYMVPLHTRFGKQIRLADVGIGATGKSWGRASDIVRSMRNTVRVGSDLRAEYPHLIGMGKGQTLRRVAGIDWRAKQKIRKLLHDRRFEADFARIDGATILPKGDRRIGPGKDRVKYYMNELPMDDKKAMALLKKIFKEADIDSIVYKNMFENRGQDSWILLDPRSQVRSPVAQFLKERGGATSGLLPLMDVLRGQREE